MPEEIEALTAVLEADIRKFEKGMGDAFKLFDQRSAQIEKRQEVLVRKLQSGFALGNIGNAIIGGAALYGLERFVSSIADTATKIQTTAQAVGVGTDALQEWGAIAERSGVNQESFNTALDRFSKNLGEAQIKGGPLATLLKSLGVDIHATTEKAFLQFSDAIAQTGSQSQKTALVVQLLGRDAANLVPFFQNGSAAIQAMGDEIKRNGGIIDQDGIRKFNEAELAWTELKRQLTITGANAISGFTDEFKNFAETLQSPEFKEALRSFGAIMADLAITFSKLGGFLPPVLAAIGGFAVGGPVGAIAAVGVGTAIAGYNALFPSHPDQINVTPSVFGRTAAGGLDRSNLLAGDSGKLALRAAEEAAKAYQELVKAIDAGNVEVLKGTLDVFAQIRKQIDDTAQAELHTAEAERDAKLAALADEVKKGTVLEADAAKVRNSLNEESASKESAILAQAQSQKLVALRDEVNARFEADQAIIERRRETVTSEHALILELARGTQDYYKLARDLSDEQAKLDEQNIQDRLKHELEVLDAQYAAADKASLEYKNYQQTRANAVEAAELRIQAIENGRSANQARLNEDESHALQNQISLMDSVRSGLENIGASALRGADAFKSATVQMIQQLAEMALKLYVLKPLIESVFGREGTNSNFLLNALGLAGGINLPNGTAIPGSIDVTPQIPGFTGGHAGGGTLPPGSWGIAGEHGPEPIFAGANPLTVIPRMPSVPSVQQQSGGRANVTITIDARGAQAGVAEQIDAAMQQWAPRIVGASVSTVKRNLAPMMAETSRRNF